MISRELLGKQISELRSLRGLNIEQLAEMAGVNSANIRKIENGKYNVNIDIVNRICDALGVCIKLDIINTLEDLRDIINTSDDWEIFLSRVIEYNGWIDETHEDYGICNDGIRRLYFYPDSDNKLVADIKDM